MIRELATPLALALAVVLPCWILLRVLIARRGATKGERIDVWRETLLLAFVAYSVAVATLTILPLHLVGYLSSSQINLVPFRTALQCLAQTLETPGDLVTHCIANFFGNIALLFPFGVLAPLVFEKLNSPRRLLIAALAISFGIETIQLLEGVIGGIRTMDIDDVMLNMLGACTGFLVLSLVRAFLVRRQ